MSGRAALAFLVLFWMTREGAPWRDPEISRRSSSDVVGYSRLAEIVLTRIAPYRGCGASAAM